MLVQTRLCVLANDSVWLSITIIISRATAGNASLFIIIITLSLIFFYHTFFPLGNSQGTKGSGFIVLSRDISTCGQKLEELCVWTDVNDTKQFQCLVHLDT